MTVVWPRLVVVSVSSVKKVYGPALPGPTHHFVTSALVCAAPLKAPWLQPVSSASPVLAPVAGLWSSSPHPQNPPRFWLPQNAGLSQLNEIASWYTSIAPSPP